MVVGRHGLLLLGLLSWCAGCGDGPPFDELPLRDALRAEPEAIAALPPASRQRLAARLEAARTADAGEDAVDRGPPFAALSAVDEARERRAADALVVGVVTDGFARPVTTTKTGEAPLPALEGLAAAGTSTAEASALAGTAGTTLRGLLAATGASRLERVVGWPIGAVTIGDTIYVDAAWLVALAPSIAEADGGAPGQMSSSRAATSILAAVAAGGTAAGDAGTPVTAAGDAGAVDAGRRPVGTSSRTVDAGTFWPPPPTSPPPPSPPPSPPPPSPSTSPDFWDACAAGADSCDTSGSESDSCGGSTDDGSSDSCGGSTDDGSSDSCSTPPDDGSSCRVAPGRERPRPVTIVWVLAPLAFLIGRRR